jgi:uncharacterized damage-inducible protein DinB
MRETPPAAGEEKAANGDPADVFGGLTCAHPNSRYDHRVVKSGRPLDGEFAAYAKSDIDRVAGDDAVAALEEQGRSVAALFARFDDARIAGRTYAPGKWTLKEILGHLIDDERIFVYRALCVARHDARELPGFDENEYVAAASFESRTLRGLLGEYEAVRASTIAFFEGLSEEEWMRRGIVNGYEASVRGLAFHIAGHELHHLRTIHAKYLTE